MEPISWEICPALLLRVKRLAQSRKTTIGIQAELKSFRLRGL